LFDREDHEKEHLQTRREAFIAMEMVGFVVNFRLCLVKSRFLDAPPPRLSEYLQNNRDDTS